MVRLIATKNLKYRKQRFNAGDEFDADGRDVKLLYATKKV